MNENNFDNLQAMYDHALCLDERFDDDFTQWMYGEHLDSNGKIIEYNIPSLNELKERHEKEQEVQWDKMVEDSEPGEIVEMYIELANYQVWYYTYSEKDGFECERIV